MCCFELCLLIVCMRSVLCSCVHLCLPLAPALCARTRWGNEYFLGAYSRTLVAIDDYLKHTLEIWYGSYAVLSAVSEVVVLHIVLSTPNKISITP